LSAGDVALLDSSQPYVIEASGSIDALWVAVPRYRVDGRLPNPHEQLGQRICGSTGSGALASNLLLDAYHQAPQLPVGTATRIGNTLLDLLALALPAAEQPMASRASTRLQRALNYIEEHLCDPTLTAQRVASAQAMSTRYLNTLFQRKATSSARWIRLRRLERCRAELQSPGARNETVAAIALRCGFSDISTFNRAFKREYGLAPAALRSTTSPPLIKVNGNKKPRPAS
jgi:AraC-like DNA-binding protein